MALTLATYNIHACIGIDGNFSPERITEVINEIRPNILALQEVEHHRINDLDLLDYISTETGLTAIVGHTLSRNENKYGNALLTTLPVTDFNLVDLTQKAREPRGAIDTRLKWNGYDIQAIATHLGLKPWERRLQTRQLLNLIEKRKTDINILMGDLNEWFLWGRPLRWLHRHFTQSKHNRTYPSRFPLFALDRIWVEPAMAIIKTTVHNTSTARIASDHLPLLTIINDTQTLRS